MRFSALPESKKRSFNPAGDIKPPQQAHVNQARGKPSMNQARRLEKYQAIYTAKRKVAVKGNIEKNHASVRTSLPFVFVGNLKSTIDDSKLKKMFGQCGEIVNIVIRCSRGAVTTAAPNSTHIDPINFRDLWYATISFTSLSAVVHALTLNGRELDGREIVVCKTAGELPEVLDFAHIRFGQNQEKKGKPNQYRRLPRRYVDA
ncbi:hypothetical protein H0H87_008602 [Tephrocybe sp. NHM501043]|nr:hypothetical protein H0H87_008602 [Tephrocybe sp. NHM501043]